MLEYFRERIKLCLDWVKAGWLCQQIEVLEADLVAIRRARNELEEGITCRNLSLDERFVLRQRLLNKEAEGRERLEGLRSRLQSLPV